jgi:large subunit ribosomal protein L15
MNLHSTKPAKGARCGIKRLGRGQGSGTGKTSGKGHKGQMARKGHKRKPTFEGGQLRLVQRVPIRGFNNYNHVEYVAANVNMLERFESGTEVTLETLSAAGIAGRSKGIPVKILGKGELSKKLTVHAHAFSEAAKAKIEAAGGSCVIIGS